MKRKILFTILFLICLNFSVAASTSRMYVLNPLSSARGEINSVGIYVDESHGFANPIYFNLIRIRNEGKHQLSFNGNIESIGAKFFSPVMWATFPIKKGFIVGQIGFAFGAAKEGSLGTLADNDGGSAFGSATSLFDIENMFQRWKISDLIGSLSGGIVGTVPSPLSGDPSTTVDAWNFDMAKSFGLYFTYQMGKTDNYYGFGVNFITVSVFGEEGIGGDNISKNAGDIDVRFGVGNIKTQDKFNYSIFVAADFPWYKYERVTSTNTEYIDSESPFGVEANLRLSFPLSKSVALCLIGNFEYHGLRLAADPSSVTSRDSFDLYVGAIKIDIMIGNKYHSRLVNWMWGANLSAKIDKTKITPEESAYPSVQLVVSEIRFPEFFLTLEVLPAFIPWETKIWTGASVSLFNSLNMNSMNYEYVDYGTFTPGDPIDKSSSTFVGIGQSIVKVDFGFEIKIARSPVFIGGDIGALFDIYMSNRDNIAIKNNNDPFGIYGSAYLTIKF